MEEYILITGASSGIGYQMAIQLAEKGKKFVGSMNWFLSNIPDFEF
jgi:short-subunit dehydrogenase